MCNVFEVAILPQGRRGDRPLRVVRLLLRRLFKGRHIEGTHRQDRRQRRQAQGAPAAAGQVLRHDCLPAANGELFSQTRLGRVHEISTL